MTTPPTDTSLEMAPDSTPDTGTDADRRGFLRAVDARLEELVTPDSDDESPILDDAASHLTLAPMAKRARPRLVYQFGRCFDVPPDTLVRLACAAELVHTASLLHDDVIDEGTERRGRQTVNRKWHNLTAVLTGDLALCLSLQELFDLPRALTRRAIDVVETMTRAIMLESTARRNPDVSVDQWRRIAVGKTGELFGWCAAAPALTVGESDWGERLFDAGRHLGAAFQRADDLRDMLGDPDDEGKDRFADLKNGVPSAVISAATQRNPDLKRRLADLWNDGPDTDEQDLTDAITDSGALDDIERDLRDDVDTALGHIGSLREHPAARDVADWASSLCLGALDLIPEDTRREET